MDKTYKPSAIEQTWYKEWEEKGYFKPYQDGLTGEGYSIMIPPPNVTGSLHMGHAFQHTIQDALTRYKRMQGQKALWQVGTDHAGIATQMVVERKLAAENQPDRHELGREKFLEKVWEWKEHSGGTITQQMRRLGNSVDWDTERFTMDDGFYKAVQEVFIRLYKDGLIYRGKRLVNWDPKLHTAISDLEVENKEEKGFFWHLRYPLADGAKTQDGKDYLVVATTRPETLLGDTAVAIHPDDERYQHLIGQSVILPLVNRRIPVVADTHADPEKGSGCVKITPAHDFNDYAVGKRNNLPMINVMTQDATIRAVAEVFNADGSVNTEIDGALPTAYAGLSREDARQRIVADLDAAGLLERVEDHVLSVPRGDRSGLIIEPMLTDQWFVDAKTLAKPAIEAVEDGRIRFVPKQYENMYFAWMRDIQDWCISRQLWWGHRIPVWSASEEATFDAKIFDGRVAEQVVSGKRYVCVRQADDSDLISSLEAAGFERDEDVLDTWFSSALWPMSTMGWPEPEAFPDDIPEGGALLDRWNPSNTLGTAREIITLWVSRMVMFNLYFRNCLSFNDVFIHAMIQDGEGQKMSKSLGNGVDPLDIVHTHGADAMRFTLASMATDMQDVRMPVDLVCPFTGEMFAPTMTTNQAGYRVAAPVQVCPSDSNKKIITSYGVASNEATPSDSMPLARNTSSRFDYGRNFANKLWNAVRFALGVLESAGEMGAKDVDPSALTQTDQWILSRLRSTIEEADRALERFEFSVYAQSLYSFTWHDLCDWYIEAVKPTVREDAAQRQVLASCIDATLRLLHPAMPFVTERLWERLNQIAPERGVVGLEIPCDALLVNSAWPK
ncbi:valine--tRNA ligase, partial [Thalassolituus sp. UBA3500]|uniref:valine--tRNA ligase n=1 Tax=Thalassolituus sp. UBA3500 TaxID=1947664 RepID=UPI00263B02DA